MTCSSYFNCLLYWNCFLLCFVFLYKNVNGFLLEITTLSDVFAKNSDLGLQIASEFLKEDKMTFLRLIKFNDDITLVIPVDQAWKKHSTLLSSLKKNNELRQSVVLNTLGLSPMNAQTVNNTEALILTTAFSQYAILSSEPHNEKSLTKICLLITNGYELSLMSEESSCSNIIKIEPFRNGLVLFVDDIIMNEAMKDLVTLALNISNVSS
jgi:hypothetical protein